MSDLGEMLGVLEALVAAESPSGDLVALDRCADVLTALGTEHWGAAPRRVPGPRGTHLWWELGPAPKVLLLGHYDTVWPLGTVARWPLATAEGLTTGPGVFDMKAGIVQALFAIGGLGDRSGVRVLLTADEETGSHTSRELVLEAAAGMDAVLVLEPSGPGGAPKIARKGVSQYRIEVAGRAAHAGLDPERGVNALVGLTEVVGALVALADPALGTTVTPTVAAAGTTGNTVPATAWVEVDARAATAVEQERVDAAVRALRPTLPGAGIAVTGGVNRPPMEPESSVGLLALLDRAAQRAGVVVPDGLAVGGASDGNFTAAAGIPTLDGLGAVGDGPHAEGEHIATATLPERALLLRHLIEEILRAAR